MLYAQGMKFNRKEDGRRKILAGALFDTANLDDLTSAQKLGLLAEAKARFREDPSLGTYWHMLGDRIFKEIQEKKSQSKKT